MIKNNFEPILKIENLVKNFPIGKSSLFTKNDSVVHAINDVSFEVFKGETLGLVGESGCGKTTLGRTIIMLYKPTSGNISYKGQNLTKMDNEGLRNIRRELRMVFQDPYSSLNPRMTVTQLVSEPLRAQGKFNRQKTNEIVEQTLSLVGLGPQYLNHYPHEFSGGQRQRIGLARALALSPEFIICDEPISALDVSIQAQVVNLLQELQRTLGLTYLFIAHDLSMVRHISDRVAVMYLGRIVEIASRDHLFGNPLHPYTEALLSSIPIPDPKIEKIRCRKLIQGDVPNPINLPSGCNFHTRCDYCDPKICISEVPTLREVRKNHFVACHLAEELVLCGLPGISKPNGELSGDIKKQIIE